MAPIREEDREFYPDNWDEISARVREEAGQRCEWCRKPNGVEVLTLPDGRWCTWMDRQWFDAQGQPVIPVVQDRCEAQRRGKTTVVLTVAHLNQDPRDNRRENLKALCQACHLRYDRRPEQRARRQKLRVERAGQLVLWEEVKG